MTNESITLTGGPIFDGKTLYHDCAALFVRGFFSKLIHRHEIGPNDTVFSLDNSILSPGYVDLQVNGGGGVMFNDVPSIDTLAIIASAHKRLGTHTLLPTFITDTADKTAMAIQAARQAVEQDIPGIAGLHLEGPHLSVERKGAHDANLIRPMEQSDLQQLLEAKRYLPVLKVTIAPENVSIDQVKALTASGVLLAIGHTNATFETCQRYANAGVSCVTHVFNAMSQLGSREPGLVGAALLTPRLSLGLIADCVHVHSAAMQLVSTMKKNHHKSMPAMYLVSDAMAVAGTDQAYFSLNERRVNREGGRLTLADGTLAGADLAITSAINNLVNESNQSLEFALQAAITVPSTLIGMPSTLTPGVTHLDSLIKISPALDFVDSASAIQSNRSLNN